MYKFVGFVMSWMLLMSLHAHAQWVHQGRESAFGDSGMQVAATAVPNYGLGLRCQDKKAEMVYSTPDTSFDKATYNLVNNLKPEILLRVDDQKVVALEAELQDGDGKLMVFADLNLAVIQDIQAAKRRVAVVIRFMEKNWHENSFGVRGSTTAINKMLKGCNLIE